MNSSCLSVYASLLSLHLALFQAIHSMASARADLAVEQCLPDKLDLGHNKAEVPQSGGFIICTYTGKKIEEISLETADKIRQSSI